MNQVKGYLDIDGNFHFEKEKAEIANTEIKIKQIDGKIDDLKFKLFKKISRRGNKEDNIWLGRNANRVLESLVNLLFNDSAFFMDLFKDKEICEEYKERNKILLDSKLEKGVQ